MIRHDVDPKETHARPVFRVLGVLFLVGMAALFFFQALLNFEWVTWHEG